MDQLSGNLPDAPGRQMDRDRDVLTGVDERQGLIESIELTCFPLTEVAERLGVSLTTVKSEVRTGALRSIKIGRRRVVPGPAIRDYIADREREAVGAGSGGS